MRYIYARANKNTENCLEKDTAWNKAVNFSVLRLKVTMEILFCILLLLTGDPHPGPLGKHTHGSHVAWEQFIQCPAIPVIC